MELIMRKEFEDRLYEVAPVFYSEKDLDAQKTCMCFGFECGDGWFEPLLDFSKEVARINEIAMKSHICFVASQIKEKFGEIRVYWHTKSFPGMCDRIPDREDAMQLYQMMNNAINTLVVRCRNTCENCGTTNHIITTDGWIQRLCKKCAKLCNRSVSTLNHPLHVGDDLARTGSHGDTPWRC